MLTKRGQYWYGDGRADIHSEIKRYSKRNGYLAQHFADAVCSCGSGIFRLWLDENEGAAVRQCSECDVQHPIGDSEEYLEDAELEECGCPCGSDDLEVSIGVALYDNSEDVRWLYVACRCPRCNLTAVYGDWQNEFAGYVSLLQNV
ncbi:hypothetical protein [Massilia agri]|uniref:Integron gene cassette protein n=1 Tax=Massilia agri TaxID=1886785 RepID=A0ABT2AL16_9BURK|nr:hypothetical protein [Massilia agri]MCS0596870.1 hypothetical protein [Massilia agri]